MRIILTALLTLLALPVQALCDGPDIRERFSAADRAAVAAAVAQAPFAQGTQFNAEKAGSQITVIGTMHLYDPRLLPLANRVATRVAASDLLLVEAGPEEEAALTQAMATDPMLMFMPDGPTLPERLDEPTWQAVAQAVSDRGLPAVLASRLQPWYVSLVLAVPPCASSELAAGRKGLDGMIISQAQTAGVPVVALEPWDTLFNLMRADPIDVQLDQLRLSLSPPELQQEMFASMLDSYFAGDIAALWEVSRVATHLIPGIDPAAADALFDASERALLVDRNRAWLPHITKAAATHDRITVAVGAAHLQGQDGILNLLTQAGWTVSRLD
ncbi:TraB/GumN family protein [Loktanella sp. M215]|uniref:TraB/GumN family protein n=1 Tax=Loktanella sp. M215 TaxID=2675431 RepID=UPI001F16D325|nr:TraB/GumN family protein [Loktanella sp. M215]MCF7699438.1 TraB/GumN family protein [Loktanella sp. M215]